MVERNKKVIKLSLLSISFIQGRNSSYIKDYRQRKSGWNNEEHSNEKLSCFCYENIVDVRYVVIVWAGVRKQIRTMYVPNANALQIEEDDIKVKLKMRWILAKRNLFYPWIAS